MTTITITEDGHKPETIRVFGPLNYLDEPWKWFRGGDRVWIQCEECLDVYHYEEEGAPDDSCLCEPCRTRPVQQRIDEEIDRRRMEDDQ